MPVVMSRSALAVATVATATLAGAVHAGQRPAPPANAVAPAVPMFVAAPPEPAGLLSREVVELWPAGRVPGASAVTATRRVQVAAGMFAGISLMYVTAMVLTLVSGVRS